MKTTAWASMSLALMALCGGAAARESRASEVRFDIAPQPLALAVNAWAEQADLQVVWPGRQSAAERVSPRVEGDLPPEKALHLLLQGSGLTYTFVDDQTVALRSEAAATTRLAGVGGESRQMTLADNRDARVDAAADEARPVDSGAKSQAAPESGPLAEVVVTGSHIRGAPVVSPVITIDRRYIEQSGYSGAQQLVSTLPQNFTGGPNENLITGSRSASLLPDGGGSANLRGLGSVSTLVLLNGARLAPSADGTFVDVSSIPLAALDRVEVLADGSSAVYGADAVAGVMNFILRDDYEGAESWLRYGGISGADAAEYQAGQLLGTRWADGHLLANYSFDYRDNVDVSSIPNTAEVAQPTDLLPKRKQHNLLVSASQEFGERTELTADLLWQDRETRSRNNLFEFLGGTPRQADSDTEALSATLGATFNISPTWSLRTHGTYSRNKAEQSSFALIGDPQPQNLYATNVVRGMDATLDGSLIDLPAGAMRLALGGAYRQEDLTSVLGFPSRLDREVTSAYGELFIPVLSPTDEETERGQLLLSLAGRYDRYSDFGSSSNPKVSLRWVPIQGLTMRASHGTSFRAPTLFNVDPSQAFGNAVVVPDPSSPTGESFAVFALGSNPDLKPETAKTFTAGFDWAPSFLAGFAFSSTYYRIKYEDRIATQDQLSILSQSDVYASLIDRSPTQQQIESVTSLPSFFNFTSLPLSDITVYVDNRLSNLGSTDTDGVDVQVTQQVDTARGLVSVQIAATKILHFDQKIAPGLASVSLLDSVYNPASLKVRANVNWQTGNWNIGASVNHTNRYRNTTGSSGGDVPSYRTFDARVEYSTPESAASSWIQGMSLSVVAFNVTNENPPEIDDPYRVNYDQENASPLPRVIAVEVKKSW